MWLKKKSCRVVLGEFNEWWCTRELFAQIVIESLEAKITKYSVENTALLISNSMCNTAFGGLAGKGRFLSLYSSQGAPFTWCVSANISTATQKTWELNESKDNFSMCFLFFYEGHNVVLPAFGGTMVSALDRNLFILHDLLLFANSLSPKKVQHFNLPHRY